LLEALLNGLVIGPNDGFGQKTWKAFRSAKNEKKLNSLYRRLEHTMNTLVVWCERNTAFILHKVNQRIQTIDAGVQEFALLVRESEARTSRTSNQVQEIIAVVSSIDVKSTGISNSLQQRIISVVEGTGSRKRDIGIDAQQALSIERGTNVGTRVNDDGIQTKFILSIQNVNQKVDVEVSKPLAKLEA
jgi:microcompartment protein CcmK/EutM